MKKSRMIERAVVIGLLVGTLVWAGYLGWWTYRGLHFFFPQIIR